MVSTQLRVIYGDTDQMGVVYYANYLRYFEAGRASARFDYRVLRDGEVLVTGHTVHACVDRDGRVKRLPGELLARLSAGEASASASASGG
jgi:acyl-CoA thioester hydrolase